MTIDIYHSRRTKYKYCTYWNRNESDRAGDASKWIFNTKPDGDFWAKPDSQRNVSPNQINNAMMFDRNNITLSTEDKIDNLERDSIILYQGHIWIVDNIQRQIHNKESEFSSEDRYTTYITLRR